MSLEWLAETVISAAVTWVVFGALTLLWARRKLLPFLRLHAPRMLAEYEERER